MEKILSNDLSKNKFNKYKNIDDDDLSENSVKQMELCSFDRICILFRMFSYITDIHLQRKSHKEIQTKKRKEENKIKIDYIVGTMIELPRAAIKAKDIAKISLENKSSIADFMIICSGTSNRHVISLSNYLVEALKKENLNTLNVEGIRNGDWVLVDAGDIIIHLFRSEVREYYGLEKMWAEEEINSYIK